MRQSRHAITFLNAEYQSILQAGYFIGLASSVGLFVTSSFNLAHAYDSLQDEDALKNVDTSHPLLLCAHGGYNADTFNPSYKDKLADASIHSRIILDLTQAGKHEFTLPSLYNQQYQSYPSDQKFLDLRPGGDAYKGGSLLRVIADESEASAEALTNEVVLNGQDFIMMDCTQSSHQWPDFTFASYAKGDQTAIMSASFKALQHEEGLLTLQAIYDEAGEGESNGKADLTILAESIKIEQQPGGGKPTLRAKAEGSNAHIALGSAEQRIHTVQVGTEDKGATLSLQPEGGTLSVYADTFTVGDAGTLTIGSRDQATPAGSHVLIDTNTSMVLGKGTYTTVAAPLTISSNGTFTLDSEKNPKAPGERRTNFYLVSPQGTTPYQNELTINTKGGSAKHFAMVSLEPETKLTFDLKDKSDVFSFKAGAYLSPAVDIADPDTPAFGTVHIKKGTVALEAGAIIGNPNVENVGGYYLVEGEQPDDATLYLGNGQSSGILALDRKDIASRVVRVNKGVLELGSSSTQRYGFLFMPTTLPLLPLDAELKALNVRGYQLAPEKRGDVVLRFRSEDKNNELAPLVLYNDITQYEYQGEPQHFEYSHLIVETPELRINGEATNPGGLVAKTDSILFNATHTFGGYIPKNAPLVFHHKVGGIQSGAEAAVLNSKNMLTLADEASLILEGSWKSALPKLVIDSTAAEGALALRKAEDQDKTNAFDMGTTKLHFIQGYLTSDGSDLDLSKATLSAEGDLAKGIKASGAHVTLSQSQLDLFTGEQSLGLVLDKDAQDTKASLTLTDPLDDGFHLNQALFSSSIDKGGLVFGAAEWDAPQAVHFESADAHFAFSMSPDGLIKAPEVSFTVGGDTNTVAEVSNVGLELTNGFSTNAQQGLQLKDSSITVTGNHTSADPFVAALGLTGKTTLNLAEGSWTVAGDLSVATEEGENYGLILGSVSETGGTAVALKAQNLTLTTGQVQLNKGSLTLAQDLQNDGVMILGNGVQATVGNDVLSSGALTTGSTATMTVGRNLQVSAPFSMGDTNTITVNGTAEFAQWKAGDTLKANFSGDTLFTGPVSFGDGAQLKAEKSLTAQDTWTVGDQAQISAASLQLQGAFTAGNDAQITAGSLEAKAPLTLGESAALTVTDTLTTDALTAGATSSITAKELKASALLHLGANATLTVNGAATLAQLQADTGTQLSAQSLTSTGAVNLADGVQTTVTETWQAEGALTAGANVQIKAKNLHSSSSVALQGAGASIHVTEKMQVEGEVTLADATSVEAKALYFNGPLTLEGSTSRLTTEQLSVHAPMTIAGTVETNGLTLEGAGHTITGTFTIEGDDTASHVIGEDGAYGLNMEGAEVTLSGAGARLNFSATIGDALLDALTKDNTVSLAEFGHYTLKDGANFHLGASAQTMDIHQYALLKQALFENGDQPLDGSLSCDKNSFQDVLDKFKPEADGQGSYIEANDYQNIAGDLQDIDTLFNAATIKGMGADQKFHGHVGAVTLAPGVDTLVVDGINSSLNKAYKGNLLSKDDGTVADAQLEQGRILSLKGDGALGAVALDAGAADDKTELRVFSDNTINSVSGAAHSRFFVAESGHAQVLDKVEVSDVAVEGALDVGQSLKSENVHVASGASATIQDSLEAQKVEVLGSVSVAENLTSSSLSLAEGASVEAKNLKTASLVSNGDLHVQEASVDMLSLRETGSLKADHLDVAHDALLKGSLEAGSLTVGETSLVDLQGQAVLDSFVGGEKSSLTLAPQANAQVHGLLHIGSLEQKGGDLRAKSLEANHITLHPEASLTTYDMTIGQQASLQGKVTVENKMTLQEGAKVDLATPLHLKHLEGADNTELNLAQGVEASVEGNASVAIFNGAPQSSFTVGGTADLVDLKLPADARFQAQTLQIADQAEVLGALTVENLNVASGAQVLVAPQQELQQLALADKAQAEFKESLQAQAIEAAPSSVLRVGSLNVAEHSHFGTLESEGEVTLAQGGAIENLIQGPKGSFKATESTVEIGSSALVKGKVEAKQMTLASDALMQIADGSVALETLAAQQGAVIEVGLEGSANASGELMVKNLALNGATLKVDPAYDKATALAVVESFAVPSSGEQTLVPELQKTQDQQATIPLFEKSDVVQGSILVGQNSALGYGCDSLEELKQVLRPYQQKGSLKPQQYGAIVYLAKGLTLGQGQSLTLTAQSTQDFSSSVGAIAGDTVFLGKNTALLLEGAATSAEKPYLSFNADHATIVADGGEIVIRDIIKSPELKLFGSAGSVELVAGPQRAQEAVAFTAEATGDASAEVQDEEPFVLVRSENGFLQAKLRNGEDGFLAPTVALAPQLDQAAAIFSGASASVQATLVDYFAQGGGENAVLNQSLSRDDGSTAERAARFALYSGALESSLLASQVLTDAVQAHLQSTRDTVVSVADEPLDKGMWLESLYRKSEADAFNAQGVDYGVENQLAGLALGFFTKWDSGVQLGAAFDIGEGKSDGTGKGDKMKEEYSFYGAALYASLSVGGFSMAADANYTALDHDMKAEWLSPDLDISPKVSAKSSLFSTGMRAQYRAEIGSAALTPRVDLRYRRLDMEDYKIDDIVATETKTMEVGSVGAGLNFSVEAASGNWTFTPAVDAHVQYNYGDTEAEAINTWQHASDLSTNVQAEIIDEIVYGAGLSLAVANEGFMLKLSADYQSSEHRDDLGAHLTLRATF